MTNDEINIMAKNIVSDFMPILKKKETERRNQSWNNMITSYAPFLAKHCREFISDEYDLKNENKLELVKNETKFLFFRDVEKNSNKYHYFVIFKFEKEGEDYFVAVNCSGRVGFIEREYDLTYITYKRPGKSLQEAKRVIDSYMNKKINKGYEEIRLRQGESDLTNFVEQLGGAYDIIENIKNKNQRLIDRKIDRELDKVLDLINDILAYSAI